MTMHIEITLGREKFKVSYFEFEQSMAIAQSLGDMISPDLDKQVKAASMIVAMAIEENHPDITPEKVAKIRGPVKKSFAAVQEILVFNEYDLSGKAEAAATA